MDCNVSRSGGFLSNEITLISRILSKIPNFDYR